MHGYPTPSQMGIQSHPNNDDQQMIQYLGCWRVPSMHKCRLPTLVPNRFSPATQALEHLLIVSFLMGLDTHL